MDKDLVLLNAAGIGAVKRQALLEAFGSDSGIVSARESDLRRVYGIGEVLAGRIASLKKKEWFEKEIESAKRAGVGILTLDDPEYPSRLREIPDAPLAIYVRGRLPDSEQACLAMVGMRYPSLYGLETAREISRALAEKGFGIVSGLARGIDTASHEGALRAPGGVTVAVLGCGLSHMYPPENGKLAGQIAQRGAVVSPFPMNEISRKQNFPARNRIISGLSLGVIVVEAGRTSGALITANFALEQGREVFAVPGPIGRISSVGTNRLIQQGAKLVQDVEDVIEELGGQIERGQGPGTRGQECHSEEARRADEESSTDPSAAFGGLRRRPERSEGMTLKDSRRLRMTSHEGEKILQMLKQGELSLEEIAIEGVFSVPTAAVALLDLVTEGLVKELPGRIFKKAD